MAARSFGLGKGLSALIPEPEPVPIEESPPVPSGEGLHLGGRPAAAPSAPQAGGNGAVLRVALGRIESNPDQPRKSFSETSIAELAESIKRHGLIQPIIVEALDAGSPGVDGQDEARGGPAARYRIVAGERRWRAAQVAALKEIPVIVRSFSAEKRLEIALIENVQREDLNPVEEAEAYRGIMEITGCTQEEVADKVGKSRPAIANALRLLKLSPTMLATLRDGTISPGHARALLAVADPTDREILFARLLAEELSVRQAEAAALDFGKGKKAKAAAAGPSPGAGQGHPEAGRRVAEILEAEQRLIEAFGTKVSIRGDLQKGAITIEYYSMDDLERILEATRAH
ncbi:MAG TPA: ParB/RepB/Spo0J family partition protein [Rectinemataceae bacterium]|nr:ParB/RepB/Spo0J family partition protein [Rectinemataceae bacterium]